MLINCKIVNISTRLIWTNWTDDLETNTPAYVQKKKIIIGGVAILPDNITVLMHTVLDNEVH